MLSIHLAVLVKIDFSCVSMLGLSPPDSAQSHWIRMRSRRHHHTYLT